MKNNSFNKYICLFIFIFIKSNLLAQENDYISSQYYQKVAQAQLLLLEGKEKESYILLSDVEKTVELLNGATTRELYYYLELSLKYQDYKKSYNCMYALISKYGYKLDDFEHMHNFKKIKKVSGWDSLKNELLSQEKKFIPDTMLYAEIKQMLEDDQYYREDGYSRIKEFIKQDTNDPYNENLSSFRLSPYMSIIDSVDNANYNKLLAIINTKGFPLSSSIKYTPMERQEVYVALFVMSVHFSDSIKINHLQPLLLQHIKQGDCPPEFLASMVDTYQSKNKQLFIYGSWNNISPEKILDYGKLDERRAEIGLPTYDLTRRIYLLQQNNLKNQPRKKKL